MSNRTGRTKRLAAAFSAVMLGLTLVPIVMASPASAAAEAPPDTTGFCANVPTDNPFTDVSSSNVHYDNILCLAFTGITQGTTATTYGPANPTRRDQMASFIARMMDTADSLDAGTNITALPAGDGVMPFTDVTSSNVHRDAIDRLQDAGIVNGTSPTTYSPASTVRRDQMASFINRALGFLTGTPFSAATDYFTDDNGNTHEDNINGLASEGIVQGTTATTYSPAGPVRRDQMASFVIRGLADLFNSGDITAATGPPAAAPDLTSASATDADGNGFLSAGDKVTLNFADNIIASSSITVKDAQGDQTVLDDDEPVDTNNDGVSPATVSGSGTNAIVFTVGAEVDVSPAPGNAAIDGTFTITAASGLCAEDPNNAGQADANNCWDPATDDPGDVDVTFPGVNQPITVTPAESEIKFTSTATGEFVNRGRKTYTVTAKKADGTPAANQAIDIALADCTQVTNNNGTLTFKDTTPDNNQADLASTNPAVFEVIAGIPVTPGTAPLNLAGDYADNVSTGSNGTLEFAIDSQGAGCVVPVIFFDTNDDDILSLTTSDQPAATETAGIGGQTLYAPPLANSGNYTGRVITVDTSFKAYTVDTNADFSPDVTFLYDSNDQFPYQDPGGPTGNLSMAQFEAFLSGMVFAPPNGPGDAKQLTVLGDLVTVGYNNDAAGQSVHTITQDAPAAVTGLTTAIVDAPNGTTVPAGFDPDTAADDVLISFTPAPNTNVDGYTVQRQILASNGAVLSTTNVDCDPNTIGVNNLPESQASPKTTRNCYDVNAFTGGAGGADPQPLTGQTVRYMVQAVDSNDVAITNINGPWVASSPALVPPAGGDTTPPRVTSSTLSNQLNTGAGETAANQFLSTGDIIVLNFNEPVGTPAANATVTFADADNTVVTLTNGTNASITKSGNQQVTITVTGAAPASQNGTGLPTGALNYPVIQTNSSGIADVAGNAYSPGDADTTDALVPDSDGNAVVDGFAAETEASFTEPDLDTTVNANGGVAGVYDNGDTITLTFQDPQSLAGSTNPGTPNSTATFLFADAQGDTLLIDCNEAVDASNDNVSSATCVAAGNTITLTLTDTDVNPGSGGDGNLQAGVLVNATGVTDVNLGVAWQAPGELLADRTAPAA